MHQDGTRHGSSDTIHPEPPASDPRDVESLDVWGFRDSGFTLNAGGHVATRGTRYGADGSEVPDLLPWMAGVLGVDIDPREVLASGYPTTIPDSRATPELRSALARALRADQIEDEPELRLRHGHGHTQDEMYAIKHESLGRVPDLVVHPESCEQVAALVALARERDLCLIPYGGGTNVTGALRCLESEARPIVSLDMRRMNRIEWIDPVNHTACIQAGAVGRHIQAQLERYGFTLGHEPDSVEFSTLGGWIATRASGMKRNRYGNIEDLVLDIEAETTSGTLARSGVAPRESTGLDPREWLLGSEGAVGIVTRAVVKIRPLPEVTRYGSILFRDFETGVAFLEDLARAGDLPASVRLLDNGQLRFGRALDPRVGSWRRARRSLERAFVNRVQGFSPERIVACTLLFEGSRGQVEAQQRQVYRLARRHRGMRAGASNGRRGYQLTFGIAYIRDFAMRHYILGESFETSVPWSRILELTGNVKQRLFEEHAKRSLPGKPFVTSRVTQLYDTGVCLYFYFAIHFKGVENPSEIFAEMERAARDTILRSGGSLSHHHGVGKLREGFLPRIMSPAALEWRHRLKDALDPDNVFGCGNQGV